MEITTEEVREDTESIIELITTEETNFTVAECDQLRSGWSVSRKTKLLCKMWELCGVTSAQGGKESSGTPAWSAR